MHVLKHPALTSIHADPLRARAEVVRLETAIARPVEIHLRTHFLLSNETERQLVKFRTQRLD